MIFIIGKGEFDSIHNSINKSKQNPIIALIIDNNILCSENNFKFFKLIRLQP